MHYEASIHVFLTLHIAAMRFLLIFTLMISAEGLVVKDEGDGDNEQQKRGNAGIGSDSVSASPEKGLSSAEERSSSEGHSYTTYGLGSENNGLGSESFDHGNTGIGLATIGLRSIALSSGGFESGVRSGKIVLLTVKGLEHGSGLGGTGYSPGTESFKNTGFSGDLHGGDSATSHVQISTVTQQLPVPVPQPVPVTANRPVPIPVSVPVPVPYSVELPRPLQISIPHPVGAIVDRPYTLTVTRPVPVPVPVPQPVHAPLPRPYVIAIPQAAPLQIPQPVALLVPRPVTVALPHPVVASSVSETDVGLGLFSRFPGTSYSTSAASISGSGHSGVAKGLGYSSGGIFAYKSNYGSSGLDLGQVSTPLKGVYVPSYLGGLHGPYGGPKGIQVSGYVEGYSGGANYVDRSSRGPGH